MKKEETIRFEQLSKEECERLWAESKPMTIPNTKYEVGCEGDMTEEEALALHESVLRGHGYFHIIENYESFTDMIKMIRELFFMYPKRIRMQVVAVLVAVVLFSILGFMQIIRWLL